MTFLFIASSSWKKRCLIIWDNISDSTDQVIHRTQEILAIWTTTKCHDKHVFQLGQHVAQPVQPLIEPNSCSVTKQMLAISPTS